MDSSDLHPSLEKPFLKLTRLSRIKVKSIKLWKCFLMSNYGHREYLHVLKVCGASERLVGVPAFGLTLVGFGDAGCGAVTDSLVSELLLMFTEMWQVWNKCDTKKRRRWNYNSRDKLEWKWHEKNIHSLASHATTSNGQVKHLCYTAEMKCFFTFERDVFSADCRYRDLTVTLAKD